MTATTETALPLKDTVEAHIVCPDVVVVNVGDAWCRQLIDTANEIESWYPSSQIGSDDEKAYTNEGRTSTGSIISARVDPRWKPFEEALVSTFHTALFAYLKYNSWLKVSCDTGYELLRYEKDQRFQCHVDLIAGRAEGQRQLSALLYLNDDYQGGELVFPRQCLKYKPKAGEVLMFPSNFCYPHESLPVIEGTKYAIVTWFAYRGQSESQ